MGHTHIPDSILKSKGLLQNVWHGPCLNYFNVNNVSCNLQSICSGPQSEVFYLIFHKNYFLGKARESCRRVISALGLSVGTRIVEEDQNKLTQMEMKDQIYQPLKDGCNIGKQHAFDAWCTPGVCKTPCF